MDIFAKLRDLFSRKAPLVACPKCSNVHDINADCVCPNCGLKYKLPPEYSTYVEKARQKEAESNAAVSGFEGYDDKAVIDAKKAREKKRSGTILGLCAFAAVFSVLFIVLMLVFFKDKDALMFKVGDYENQPVFYKTEDGILHCAFPNDKNCSIGNGNLVSYLSSANGKCVYLVYSGEFASSKTSNFVLKISGFGKKTEKIFESSEFVPHIAAGGDNKYLYILCPKDGTDTVFDLFLSTDGEKPLEVAKNVREIAVSTSGRRALLSLDENGTTKLMVYSAPSNAFTNPGIKNAHPLSIDNKGEYMIYAKKNTAESTDIIVEKSTTERVEIPIFKQSELLSVVFSEDRRSFAAIYSDKTVFYSCRDDDYTISGTSEGSLFGYDFNDNVCHNLLTFKEIPQISNIHGKEFLPFFYYDSEHKFVYSISEGGARKSVFDTHSIDELRVSDNGKCAFVSDGILYTGKLNTKNNELVRICSFDSRTLIDISADGKYVYYKDADENMFRLSYGKANGSAKKLSVDVDVVKSVSEKDMLLTISENTLNIIDKKGNSSPVCTNPDTSLCCITSDNFSDFFFGTVEKDEPGGKENKTLYLYDGGKIKLVSKNIDSLCGIKESTKIDISRSSYVKKAQPSDDSQSSAAEAGVTVPVPVQVPAA